MKILKIDKRKVPYGFRIELTGDMFTFYVKYNARGDYYTVDLWAGEEVLTKGEKIVLNSPLFQGMSGERRPDVMVMPFDYTATVERVGYREMGTPVALYLLGGDIYDGDF